jgi:hypothetical protein
MRSDVDFAPYRPLPFTVNYEHCTPHPAWTRSLQFEVTELWGTSSEVAPGERYVVRGTYVLPGDEPFAVSLAVLGKAFGATAHVPPGRGTFETSTEVLSRTESRTNGLGIVVGRGRDCVMTAWIALEG